MAKAKEDSDRGSLETYLNTLVPDMRMKLFDRYRTNLVVGWGQLYTDKPRPNSYLMHLQGARSFRASRLPLAKGSCS
ncbi:hypothetical protein F4776DRAFT_644924 [Hypoxylon sp. NC0597]|nr:hypothetical protein F4776DRAFT_644924 [Hypoxylon sp. NC0597]